jgi:hypothetical protein
MLFPIRTIALIGLSLTHYSAASPIVQEREVQERRVQEAVGNAIPLITNINALATVLSTAQNAVTGLSTPGGVTVATISVRTYRLRATLCIDKS